jgi:hypothetical protein
MYGWMAMTIIVGRFKNCNMLPKRNAPVDMQGSEFKQTGYQLIGQIADFIDNIRRKPVTTKVSSTQLSDTIGLHSLPEYGKTTNEVVKRASGLLFNYSLLNGHPKFLGYITSSAAPIGALADLLAAAVNPNVGAYILSPVATTIERQVVKWLGEFIGVPACFDGILVSGGNMANFTAFSPPSMQRSRNVKRRVFQGPLKSLGSIVPGR